MRMAGRGCRAVLCWKKGLPLSPNWIVARGCQGPRCGRPREVEVLAVGVEAQSAGVVHGAEDEVLGEGDRGGQWLGVSW